MKKTLPDIQLELNTYSNRYSRYAPSAEPTLSGKRIIPVCSPDIGHRERRYVLKAFDSSWISSAGDYVDAFERAFAKTVSHTKYALSVNSGTSALHLCVVSLGIGQGDEVIVPAFTMIASANAVTYSGAKPVFVDARQDTWNLNESLLEWAVTKRTKAIMVVHTYGSPVDMPVVLRVARKHGLWVIEDAAEAHGSEVSGKRTGGIGDVAAFSLYANKTITTGEGGMVTTNSAAIAERVALLRNHALTEGRHFWHPVVGYGYKMTSLQAAVGLAQVERFSRLLAARRRNAALYIKTLTGTPGINLPTESHGTVNSYWMFGITIDEQAFGMSRDRLRKFLADMGIETRSFFTPIPVQPPYVVREAPARFPVAIRLGREELCLPSSSGLPKRDILYICSAIKTHILL